MLFCCLIGAYTCNEVDEKEDTGDNKALMLTAVGPVFGTTTDGRGLLSVDRRARDGRAPVTMD